MRHEINGARFGKTTARTATGDDINAGIHQNMSDGRVAYRIRTGSAKGGPARPSSRTPKLSARFDSLFFSGGILHLSVIGFLSITARIGPFFDWLHWTPPVLMTVG